MLTQNKVLLVKTESAGYGVDAAPTVAADFLAVHNVTVSPNLTYNETQGQDVSLSRRAGTLGRKFTEITFDYELQMATSAPPAPPPCDAILLAAGFDDSAVNNVYIPTTMYVPNRSSCTIWLYEEDILWKITGCRGNVAWNFVAGQPVILSCTFQGLFATPIDSAFPSSIADRGTKPVIAMNRSFDWGSPAQHPVIENLTFTLGNALAQRPTMGDGTPHGIAGIEITDRAPEGSFDPEMVKSSVHNFLGHFGAVTQTPISYVVGDGARTMSLLLPKTEIITFSSADRGGTAIYEFPFHCIRDTGDDEIRLTFA